VSRDAEEELGCVAGSEHLVHGGEVGSALVGVKVGCKHTPLYTLPSQVLARATWSMITTTPTSSTSTSTSTSTNVGCSGGDAGSSSLPLVVVVVVEVAHWWLFWVFKKNFSLVSLPRFVWRVRWDDFGERLKERGEMVKVNGYL